MMAPATSPVAGAAACASGREAGMGPNVEAINVRLSHLQNVRADLLRKAVALTSLRKQVH